MVFRSNLVVRSAVLVLFAVIGSVTGRVALAAESFRIVTKIYAGDEKDKKKQEPVSKSTTLFQDNVVYDFLEQPEQTAVFRRAVGDKPARFILLDNQKQVQTEVSTEKISAAMKDLRSWAEKQKNPFLQFSAKPEFTETYDRDTGKLVLASSLETYTVETSQSQHQEAVAPYREYLDWYTQLNTLLATGTPPDPRLKLNEALARHKAFPSKVELKRTGQDPLRAEHDFTWRLSQDDLQRIEDVRAALTTYRSVENQEFLKMSQPAAPVK